MKKEIKAWVWNPENSFFKEKKSEKAVGHIISCECPEKCELYSKGNCIISGGYYCPYGDKRRVVGFSRMASKFYSWINDFEKAHKDVYRAELKKPEKLEYFIDLVYITISHLCLNEEIQFVAGGGIFSNDKPIIKREHFNADFIKKQILNFKPRSLMGGTIYDYQDKEVPKFLLWLKQLDNALYEEVKEMCPNLPIFKFMTNVGRKAVLQTLNPNIGTFKDIHGGIWTWDGEYLCSNNTHASFTLIETREIQECRLKPKDNVVVKVCDDAQVNDNTEFID